MTRSTARGWSLHQPWFPWSPLKKQRTCCRLTHAGRDVPELWSFCLSPCRDRVSGDRELTSQPLEPVTKSAYERHPVPIWQDGSQRNNV